MMIIDCSHNCSHLLLNTDLVQIYIG